MESSSIVQIPITPSLPKSQQNKGGFLQDGTRFWLIFHNELNLHNTHNGKRTHVWVFTNEANDEEEILSVAEDPWQNTLAVGLSSEFRVLRLNDGRCLRRVRLGGLTSLCPLPPQEPHKNLGSLWITGSRKGKVGLLTLLPSSLPLGSLEGIHEVNEPVDPEAFQVAHEGRVVPWQLINAMYHSVNVSPQ